MKTVKKALARDVDGYSGVSDITEFSNIVLE